MPQDTAPRILVVDDDPTFRSVLEMRLQGWGYEVRTASSAPAAEEEAEQWRPHLILSDVVMPEVSGIQLLERLRSDDGQRPVILLTAHGTVEMAVEAMKLGAVDFLTKPLNYGNLSSVLKETLKSHSETKPPGVDGVEAPPSEDAEPDSEEAEAALGDFVGTSPAMREVYRTLRAVAGADAAVLITGESGTGKELAAQTIHELSPRSEGPFVPVNASAIPATLMESEIFGHEKGAFTGATESRPGCFELADQGTLFLDEIAEMPTELQPKLLRVLDRATLRRLGGKRDLSFNVRTITATNRDPRKAVSDGILREDLFYRLNVLHVYLPPLREREGDVPLLATRFAEIFSGRHGGPSRTFTQEAMGLLEKYPWPGNVRELRNVVERAVVLAGEGIVGAEHLPIYVRRPETGGAEDYTFPTDATAADVERELILRTLERTGNNKSETARRLGVSVRTIHNKLRRYGIER